MNIPVRTVLALLAGLSITYACSTTGDWDSPSMQTLESEVIHNTLLCGEDIKQPGLRWITDAEVLRQRYQGFDHTNELVGELPEVDFSNDGVLLIAMGPRPTSGYRLNKLAQQEPRSGRIGLQVPVAWQEPSADSAQAQVLTNPCLLLAIPNQDYKRIRVIDQNGAVKLETEIE